MDFGVKPVFDGQCSPDRDAALRLAWFERSSAEQVSARERWLAESGLLDRLREADGLVYDGEGDIEL